MTMSERVWQGARRAGLASIVAAGLLTAVGAGQERQAPAASRLMVQETSLPPIDRGLRDQDPPRAARGSSDSHGAKAQGAGRAAFIRGSVIVKFRDGTSSGAIASATRQVAGDTVDRTGWANFDIIDIPDAEDPDAAAAALRARPDVEYAQPRYLNHAMGRPHDPLYANQWNFPANDMERAWDIQPGATADIIVAVLDSGVAHRGTTLRYNSRFPFQLTEEDGVTFELEPGRRVYPALGVVHARRAHDYGGGVAANVVDDPRASNRASQSTPIFIRSR